MTSSENSRLSRRNLLRATAAVGAVAAGGTVAHRADMADTTVPGNHEAGTQVLLTSDTATAQPTPGGALTSQLVGQLLWPQTPAEIAAGVTPHNYGYPAGNVLRYGADPTGRSDSTRAFVACSSVISRPLGDQAVRSAVLYVPVGLYRLDSNLSFPPGTLIQGGGCFSACTNPQLGVQGGTILQFAGALTGACVTIGDGTGNLPGGCRDLSVTRTPGSMPPAGSIAIYVNGGHNIVIENVLVYNHAIGVHWQAVAPSGLGGRMENFYSGYLSDCHIEVDQWPELYIVNSRLGMDNTANNLSCDCYMRTMGGAPGTASGPNGIFWVGCQINQGSPFPNYFWKFENLDGTIPTTDSTDFHMTACHVEGLNTAAFYSDSTYNELNRLFVTNCNFNTPGLPLFSLDPSTQPSQWSFGDNYIACSDITLAPTLPFTSVNFSNNTLNCELAITGVAGSTLQFDNNTHADSVAVNGIYSQLALSGDRTNGAFTWNATVENSVQLGGIFSVGTWTPQLAFGGSSSGMTSTSAGTYQIMGNYITVTYTITLTALGSAAGAATIGGLPFPYGASAPAGGGGPVIYAANLVGLNGTPVAVSTAAGARTLALSSPSSGGLEPMTESNFTDTAIISGNATYMWQGQ